MREEGNSTESDDNTTAPETEEKFRSFGRYGEFIIVTIHRDEFLMWQFDAELAFGMPFSMFEPIMYNDKIDMFGDMIRGVYYDVLFNVGFDQFLNIHAYLSFDLQQEPEFLEFKFIQREFETAGATK